MSAPHVADDLKTAIDGVELDPHRYGRHRARLEPEGRPVWAIIADLEGTNGDVAETAFSYGISEDAVRRAIAYYEQNREIIDAFLLINREGFR